MSVHMGVSTIHWVVPLALSLVTVRASAQSPPDDEGRKVLADRVNGYRRGVGIVIGVIERIARHGLRADHVAKA